MIDNTKISKILCSVKKLKAEKEIIKASGKIFDANRSTILAAIKLKLGWHSLKLLLFRIAFYDSILNAVR